MNAVSRTKLYVEILRNSYANDIAFDTGEINLSGATRFWAADLSVKFQDAKPRVRGRESTISSVSVPASASSSGTTHLRRVRHDHEAGPHSIKVSLFHGTSGGIRGWFIGPLSFTSNGVILPYLAPSDETIASVAVIRAIDAAAAAKIEVCLVDPEDLWESIWRP